jgi:hypothetical protein
MGAISQGFAKRSTPRGFRASGIYGGFAAVAGVARLLRLDAEATAHALGMAASAASGTNQTWVSGTQEWQMQLGLASVASGGQSFLGRIPPRAYGSGASVVPVCFPSCWWKCVSMGSLLPNTTPAIRPLARLA